MDDHQYWQLPPDAPKTGVVRQNQWSNNREKLQTEMETMGNRQDEDTKSLLEQVQVENRSRYDYRRFLQKFSVLREEMLVDEDSFDYVFYTYGLSLYGNMPLVEPLESKEVSRIEDFVLVIDTSMSCSGDLVRRFLEETYRGINRRLLMIVGILFLAVFLVLTLFLKIYFIIAALESIMLGMLTYLHAKRRMPDNLQKTS